MNEAHRQNLLLGGCFLLLLAIPVVFWIGIWNRSEDCAATVQTQSAMLGQLLLAVGALVLALASLFQPGRRWLAGVLVLISLGAVGFGGWVWIELQGCIPAR